MGITVLLIASFVAAGQAEGVGEISGTAVNGTAGGAPLAGAEVVLRASEDGEFVPVAATTTDANGWFSFSGLPVDSHEIYLPGINRAGIHYPGPRVRLTDEQAAARVKLIGYDTVASPSPLVSRRHEMAITAGEGFLEVTETLAIENPSRTTFVGYKENDRPPVTLRLSLPDGIEKVTFDREFHGRNFRLQEGKLITEIPWPPGNRELKFIYRVPVERTYAAFERVLDQPTDRVVLQVTAKDDASLSCSLPRLPLRSKGERVYESRGGTLPEGYQITLRLGDVPLRFETYARWTAVAVLLALVAGSAALYGMRRPDRAREAAGPLTEGRQFVSRRRGSRKARTLH